MTFQFSKRNEITLSICDKDYTLVKGDMEALRAIAYIYTMLDKIKEDNFDDKVVFLISVSDTVMSFVDGLFGQGSYAAIFAGRRVTIDDMVELCEYITTELDRLGVGSVATAQIADVLEVADDKPASS